MRYTATISLMLIIGLRAPVAVADSPGAIFAPSVGCVAEQTAINISTPKVVTLAVQNDTYIRLASPGTNYGAATEFVVDRETDDLQRALIKFNLASIPSGVAITSAVVKLQATAVSGSLKIDVHQIQNSWDVSSVSWSSRSTGVNWATPGGDYANAVSASLTTSTPGEQQFNITELAQFWYFDPAQNHGVIVVNPDAGSDRTATYDTQDRSGGTPPVLEVSYLTTAATSGCQAVATGESINIKGYSSNTRLYDADLSGQTLYIPDTAVALH